MAEGRVLIPRCEVDKYGCVRLSSILQAFNAPINEEHAWAVCYQTAKCFLKEWEADSPKVYCLNETSQIRIQKDGTIHSSSVRDHDDGTTRPLATNIYQIVTSLGLVIFHALDYGLCEDEDRNLSQSLEILIDRMTSADPDDASDASGSFSDDVRSQNADEGIEKDSGEDDPLEMDDEGGGKKRNGLTLQRVIEMCASHLLCPSQADSHYKAVCRALVAEALELSSFLEKISKGTKILRESVREDVSEVRTLDMLKCQDWAMLWMQVIKELRQGVKLKKVDFHSHPQHSIEYELTPFEMLLDDIRSQRYKLNKVMVNGDIPPRVKKDAHALILEFIRSRPPLVPVSKRKLPPPPQRPPTLYEKLMASIRQHPKLKPTPTRSASVETSRTKLCGEDSTPQPCRRVIKPNLNLRLSSSFDDDDGDEDLPPSPVDEQPQSLPVTESKFTKERSPWQTMALDLAKYSTDFTSERRHSISVCESPSEQFPSHSKGQSSSQRNNTLANGHSNKTYLDSTSVIAEYWKASQLGKSLECLSLTLEEIVHIRNVLTKAELESLLVDKELHNEVEKGKICFTCKKTRFSFFGSWGVKCKLCERLVCEKCSTKMRIPVEHFSNIPVYMLSPTPSPPPEEVSFRKSFWKLPEALHFSRLTSGSAPSSPNPSARKENVPQTIRPSSAGSQRRLKHSESIHVLCDDAERKRRGRNAKRVPLMHSKTVTQKLESPTEEEIRGQLMRVCRGCKGMVCHIILASRNTVSTPKKMGRTIQNLPQHNNVLSCTTACLSPVEASPPSSPKGPFVTNFPNRLV
ncbi:protein spire homolog 1-like [Limulus polyphemus]|uniref:Protein spire homolog 1-like n=1 Tax=Limulus polyphemus TaxID=6850 RepID=A0ABM1S165_LIMPO|nr:protein spire homolog 1-like [Limulus polyphemus]